MSKIDTSGWKEFRLSALGFTVIHGKRMKQADREDGDIPLLTAGKENQGIGSYISNPLITCENAITVDMFGNSFYHHGTYAGDDNIYFFVNDDISETAKMFMASILNAENIRLYDFKHQFRQPDADILTIPLPATPSGDPDWNYMENYMKKVFRESESRLENLRVADKKKKIETEKWKKFGITDLFDVVLSNDDLQPKKLDEGDIPLLSSGKSNNGIVMYIPADTKAKLFPANTITVDMFGKAFFHDYQYFAVSHGRINMLLPKSPLNTYTGIYLAQAIESYIAGKYGFTSMCNQKMLKSETISLPVTSFGEPDWKYMEEYMRNVMKKSEEKINEMKEIMK